MRRLMMIAAVVPVAIGTLVILAFAVLETGGRTPMSIHPGNLAEAAAMGNAAETVRRLSFGESPYRIQPIREDIVGSDPIRLTALEAAVVSKKLELIRLLDSRGVFVGEDARRTLACLATDIGASDITEYLGRGLTLDCGEPGATRLRILTRGQSAETP